VVKCVEHILTVLGMVLKALGPLRKLFSTLVSQAGYGPIHYQNSK